jgi:hypothetical protein
VPHGDRADRQAGLEHGDGQRAPEADLDGEVSGLEPLRVLRDVRHMDGGARENRPPGERLAARRRREVAPGELERRGWIVVLGHHVDQFAVEAVDRAEEAAAQAGRALRDGLEDGLGVHRGAADRVQDLPGGGLLLQGLRERLVLSLQLGEHAHVLDRDHRLVGEGLEQRHVRVREAAGFPARHQHGAEGVTLAEHRHRDDAPEAELTPHPADVLVDRCVLGVRHVHHGACEDRHARDGIHAERPGVPRARRGERLR